MMRNVLNLVAVALLSTSTLALSSPGLRGIAKKPTRVRAQREQDAGAQIHKTPAQVEGALKATVARGEHDDTAANFAGAHARADGAAAPALGVPANMTTSAIFILCCWGWHCKKRCECKKKESDEIVIQDATVVEEGGSRKASAPPAPPALAAAPESRTYSGTYSITMAQSA